MLCHACLACHPTHTAVPLMLATVMCSILLIKPCPSLFVYICILLYIQSEAEDSSQFMGADQPTRKFFYGKDKITWRTVKTMGASAPQPSLFHRLYMSYCMLVKSMLRKFIQLSLSLVNLIACFISVIREEDKQLYLLFTCFSCVNNDQTLFHMIQMCNKSLISQLVYLLPMPLGTMKHYGLLVLYLPLPWLVSRIQPLTDAQGLIAFSITYT